MVSISMNVRHPSFVAALAALLVLGSGCHPPDSESSDDGISDTTDPNSTVTDATDDVADNGESTGDGDTTDSTDDTTGNTCGGELWSATSIASNILIVQDRSGSMEEEIDGMTKWEIAQAAIEQVVTAYSEEVYFGLMLYPGLDESCDEGVGCGPGNIFVDIGPDTADEIIAVLGDSNTCSLGTPTGETLAPLRDYPGLEDVQRPNFVLLITDGQSTCDDPVPEVEKLLLEEPMIKTFVVGFGEGVDPGELDDMAQAGGTALLGDTKYYQADNAQALEDAFAEIATNLLSCSYVLEQVPPNPDDLYIYVDDILIERDQTHANGWDYDEPTNQITFYGPACEDIQSQDAQNLEIIFGCPMVG